MNERFTPGLGKDTPATPPADESRILQPHEQEFLGVVEDLLKETTATNDAVGELKKPKVIETESELHAKHVHELRQQLWIMTKELHQLRNQLKNLQHPTQDQASRLQHLVAEQKRLSQEIGKKDY
jgi:ABC-type phosphate transport system auxiliary subunit